MLPISLASCLHTRDDFVQNEGFYSFVVIDQNYHYMLFAFYERLFGRILKGNVFIMFIMHPIELRVITGKNGFEPSETDIAYCLNHEKYLKVFLVDGEAPMVNNATK